MSAIVAEEHRSDDAEQMGADDDRGHAAGRSGDSPHLVDVLLKFLATKEDVAKLKGQIDRLDDRLERLERMLVWVLGIITGVAVAVLAALIGGWLA